MEHNVIKLLNCCNLILNVHDIRCINKNYFGGTQCQSTGMAHLWLASYL